MSPGASDHSYTDANYARFRELFDQGLIDVQHRFDRLIQLFHDVLPYEFRTLLIRARRQLLGERATYLRLPQLLSGIASLQSQEGKDQFFQGRFEGVVRTLANVAREADRLREEVDAASADDAI